MALGRIGDYLTTMDTKIMLTKILLTYYYVCKKSCFAFLTALQFHKYQVPTCELDKV